MDEKFAGMYVCMYVCMYVFRFIRHSMIIFLSQRDLICKYIAEVIYGNREKKAERRGLMVGIGIFPVALQLFIVS